MLLLALWMVLVLVLSLFVGGSGVRWSYEDIKLVGFGFYYIVHFDCVGVAGGAEMAT